MAKFSVGGEEEGEGPSRPRPKRARLFISAPSTSSLQQTPSVPPPIRLDFDDNDNDEGQGGEEEEHEESDASEEEEEDEDNDNDGYCQTATVGPITPSNMSSSCSRPSSNGSVSISLTDPEVLDCPICCEPLTVPVFQCDNGHIACSSCCKKLAQKCPSCSLPIGYNRCRAIEKVLEAVKISCQNFKYGCREMISYSKKYDHDKSCIHVPCYCPLTGCSFICSSKQLFQHCRSMHASSVISFQFDSTFLVFLTTNTKYLVLQEEKDGVLFILGNKKELIGNMITVNCIGLSSSKGGYFYDLKASTEGSNLIFQSSTKIIQRKNEETPLLGFLLVPGEFFGSFGQISLELCIWSHGKCPADIRGSNSVIQGSKGALLAG